MCGVSAGAAMLYLIPEAASVTTAKGETSDPVPEVVGMVTMVALAPSMLGIWEGGGRAEEGNVGFK